MAGDACPGGSVLLDIRSQAERTTGVKKTPGIGQGIRDTDGQIIQKVVQGPFKVQDLLSAALPARKGIRYFIHSYWITARDDGGHATTLVRINATIGGTGYSLGYLSFLPSVAGVGNITGVSDVLCDVNTQVTIVTDVAPTAYRAGVTYCEVSEGV